MFVEGFGGCLPAKGLSWPGVECDGDRVEVGSRVSGEVGALGEVLPEQAVGVLVGATLPGTARIAEVEDEPLLDLARFRLSPEVHVKCATGLDGTMKS